MDAKKCVVCSMEIEGKYLTVNDKYYCQNHFTCTSCKTPIEGSYRTRNEQPFCASCYVKNFAKICYACKEPIESTVITAMDQTWHKDHFVCTTCKKPLVGTQFMTNGDKPYCKDDFYSAFGERCSECNLIITESLITALGKKWHQECFKCGVCSKPMTDEKFSVRDQKPICSGCI